MRSFVFLCAAAIMLPFSTHAAVVISEIMYDPPTPESSNEWIEVCNTGSSSVDIASWSVVESNRNRALTPVSGGTNLDAGACAIIARSTSAVPGYSGMLFTSTFSLSNSGETLALEDGAGTEHDAISYDPSRGGREAEAESLHRSGSTFTSGAPTPGSYTAEGAQEGGAQTARTTQNTSGTTNATTLTTLYAYESVTIQPPEDVFVRVPETLTTTVGALTEFRAETYDATGAAFTDGTVHWAFGDGGSATGRRVMHEYTLDGEYMVRVRLERGALFDAHTIAVRVVPLAVWVTVDPAGQWVALENKSTNPLALGGWRLALGERVFVIPEGTTIASKGTVRFSRERLGAFFPLRAESVSLVYPSGRTAAKASVAAATTTDAIRHDVTRADTYALSSTQTARATTSEEVITSTSVPARVASVVGAPVPARRTVPVESVDTQEQPAITTLPRVATTTQYAAAAVGSGGIYWYIGLSAVLVLGGATVLLLRRDERDEYVVDGFTVREVNSTS